MLSLLWKFAMFSPFSLIGWWVFLVYPEYIRVCVCVCVSIICDGINFFVGRIHCIRRKRQYSCPAVSFPATMIITFSLYLWLIFDKLKSKFWHFKIFGVFFPSLLLIYLYCETILVEKISLTYSVTQNVFFGVCTI